MAVGVLLSRMMDKESIENALDLSEKEIERAKNAAQ
jgi:hypothetical protein